MLERDPGGKKGRWHGPAIGSSPRPRLSDFRIWLRVRLIKTRSGRGKVSDDGTVGFLWHCIGWQEGVGGGMVRCGATSDRAGCTQFDFGKFLCALSSSGAPILRWHAQEGREESPAAHANTPDRPCGAVAQERASIPGSQNAAGAGGQQVEASTAAAGGTRFPPAMRPESAGSCCDTTLPGRSPRKTPPAGYVGGTEHDSEEYREVQCGQLTRQPQQLEQARSTGWAEHRNACPTTNQYARCRSTCSDVRLY